MTYLCEVGALGAPHGRGAESEDDGAGDEGEELGVELGADVGGVAEHGEDHRPLHSELLDHEGREEHARDDERRVDHRQRVGAETINLE